MEKEHFHRLRQRHRRLRYLAGDFCAAAGELKIGFHFFLEPDVHFHPRVIVPCPQDLDPASLREFVFNLGMIELLSYWKCACPAEVVIEAGYLSARQIAWWKTLLKNGLGEFFFLNNLDPSLEDLVTFEVLGPQPLTSLPTHLPCSNDGFLLCAGGKDTAVSLALLQEKSAQLTPLLLNPQEATMRLLRSTKSWAPPLVARRSIDPLLLQLNAAGYLNGHTPFSAYLAFLGALTARAWGKRYVVVSNESSANEANIEINGFAVNHQYSKSFHFERAFRDYCAEFLSPSIDYFSFLRPLSELQICAIFSQFPQYLPLFRSCNVGSKDDIWCGKCPKCAFVYLALLPFFDAVQLQQIFSADLLNDSATFEHLRGLLGLGDLKPLECVGSYHDSRTALQLAQLRAQSSGHAFSPRLAALLEELALPALDAPAKAVELLNCFDDNNFVPAEFSHLLKQALASLELGFR